MRLVCAILTYVVMVIVSVCVVIATAEGRDFKQQPIPWQYDYPYSGELTVRYVEPNKTHEACGFKDAPTVGVTGYVQACAYARKESCTIVLPFNNGVYSTNYYQYIIRHEIAHCNGWKHNN